MTENENQWVLGGNNSPPLGYNNFSEILSNTLPFLQSLSNCISGTGLWRCLISSASSRLTQGFATSSCAHWSHKKACKKQLRRSRIRSKMKHLGMYSTFSSINWIEHYLWILLSLTHSSLSLWLTELLYSSTNTYKNHCAGTGSQGVLIRQL